jgi:hypothetical protein
MRLQQWLRNGLTQPRMRHVSPTRPLRRGGFGRRTITPCLEALEDRTLPSTFTVTNLLDDGSAGSLRYEIQQANSTPGANIIDFAHGLHGVITLTQGQLNITNSVAVNGPGAKHLTIGGNSSSRIFDISSGTTVTLAGLTLSNGQATTGAGIYNAGSLTLSKDVLSDNVAQGAANGGNAFGGGLYNAGGVVAIDHSTFTGNQALGGDGGVTSSTGSGVGSSNGETAILPGGIRGILVGVGMGGGLWNDGGSVTVTDSTFANNLAQGGSNGNVNALPSSVQFVFAGNADGGGIGSGAFFTTATPTVSLTGSTLSDNQAIGGTNINYSLNTPSDAGNSHGGGLGALAGNVSVSNSTVAGNLSEDGANQTAAGGFTFASGGTTYTVTYQESLGGSASGGGIDDEFYPGHFIAPAATPTLRISGSTLSNNVALGNGPQASGDGGGLNTLFVNAQLTNSTVHGNQAVSGPGGATYRSTAKAVTSKGAASTFGASGPIVGGGTASGGGLFSSHGSLTISGSTVNGNAAKGSPGGTLNVSGFGALIAGGGISSEFQTLQLTNSTLSDNSAVGGNATLVATFSGIAGGAAYGGALFLQRDAASAISGAAFIHNLAQGGAGIGTGGFAQGGYGQGGGVGIGGHSGPLQVTDCLFLGNQGVGGSGGASGVGGFGQGGGFLNYETSATIDSSQFILNQATGGGGGSGAAGGPSEGGGLWNIGSVTIDSSQFVLNQATGGVGGSGGAGGISQGGGLFNDNSSATINASQFIANQAIGGAGGTGANGGNGLGGGLYNAFFSSATIDASQFTANGAIGGAGGTGANGGNGQGGGILNGIGALFGTFYDTSSLTLQNSQLHGNRAEGGAGGAGGNGGNGLGGGLFSAAGSTATLLGDAISGNIALGGFAGSGGSAGLGEGGGLYIDALAMVCADLATQQHLHGNHASTSYDDMFGTLGTCS